MARPARYRAFTGRFPYTLTADQESAVEACLHDLASGKPMNRVICGDVGFGKTEIALRATAAVALAGRQVAILAPTTVLARQHFSTFARRFAGLDIAVKMLSRVVSPREIAEVKTGLASGEVDIVVGTQAILAKDISFSSLGLIIADEEHRFGVGDREKMRHFAPGLHTLTMSATPIPRSLQAAMIGIEDVSLLRIPPARRRPVRTSLVEFDETSVATALRRERRRAGQSFFVVPRIEDIDELQVILKTLVPEMTVLVAHGKMRAAEMDDVVVRFAEGDGDILLSTNIIESGLDIPQANTIFIWRADRFGLAQLHQLRGRVGRGRAQGFAYLLSRSDDSITETTQKRLDTMIQFDRLGSGLAIALRDLDLRGAGDLAGEEQAGHMKKLGTGFYQKLLAAAILNARNQVDQTDRLELDLGFTGYIPSDYVPDAIVRLSLYTRLMRLTDPVAVDDFGDELLDRFGEMPLPVQHLMRIAKLKLVAVCYSLRKLSAGPLALAISFGSRSDPALARQFSSLNGAHLKGDRIVFKRQTASIDERLTFFEEILAEPK